VTSTVLSVFLCPSDPRPVMLQTYTGGSTHYHAQNAAPSNYVFAGGRRVESNSFWWRYDTDRPWLIDRVGRIQSGLAAFGNNNSSSLRDWTDGTSNCILIGESVRHKHGDHRTPLWGQGRYSAVYARVLPRDDANHRDVWRYRINSKWNNFNQPTSSGRPLYWVWSSHHAGGTHMTFGDGSVRFLNENMDLNTYWILNFIKSQLPAGDF
jgi:prepilin-type processing-associated H-X9-DG protein